jgi:hypothetical protein
MHGTPPEVSTTTGFEVPIENPSGFAPASAGRRRIEIRTNQRGIEPSLWLPRRMGGGG